MLCFKILHALHESVDTFDCLCVVAAGTETTDRTVTLNTNHTVSYRIVEEWFLPLFVFVVHHEADVHNRTVFLCYGTLEQLVAVDFRVNDFSTFLCSLVHRSYTAVFLNPTQIFKCCIDRNNWRSIEHRTFVYVCTVVEHCWYLTWSLAQLIVLYDDDSNTCHRQILLCTGIDTVVFCYIYGTAEDI